MLTHLRRSIVMTIFCIAFFGFIYALAGTGVAQALFSHQANGSIGADGSTLIGQDWSSPKWFHGRPDDAGPYAASKTQSGGDNPLEANGNRGESGASNLGPRSKVLLQNTQALVAYWHAQGVNPTPDLVTTSGSGYDPDIAPDDATVQIPMVSRATGLSPATLSALIKKETHSAEMGFLGSRYIDVLQLNQALDQVEAG